MNQPSLEEALTNLGLSEAEVDRYRGNLHSISGAETLQKHLDEIRAVYCWDDLRIKSAILKFPQFASYDHTRVVADATIVYQDSERVKSAILKFPPFAGLDHTRVVADATEVYQDGARVKSAILKHPPFANLDHRRVLRQKGRLGRMVQLSEPQVIAHILDNPVLASYSARRYIAGLDIARALEKEGLPMDQNMLSAYLSYFPQSPYVPGTTLRISQAPEGEEPPLMIRLKKKLRSKTL